jgi:NADH-quinone oxidoreductase subunit C
MQSNLNNEMVTELVKNQFGDAIISTESPYDFLTIEVTSSSIYDVIEWIKDEPTLMIAYLTNLGAVHYPESEGREFAIVYHLHSLINNFRIRLKAFISIENPQLKSLVPLYSGANWMERETFDFYGITFIGHPNLVRILNEDTMDYFPMRKEFHLEDATREDKDDRFFGR